MDAEAGLHASPPIILPLVFDMKKDRRKMILDAANTCFVKYGYKKTTLEDISKIVGIRKASLYYYFKSKAEIYITLVTNEYRNLITKLNEEIEADMTCEEKILVYFAKRMDWLFEQSSILTQITQEELNLFNELGTDIVSGILVQERSIFTNIITDCIKKKHIKKIDVGKITNYIFILVDGIYSHYRSPSSIEVVTEEENKMVKSEISTALKLFIHGIKRE